MKSSEPTGRMPPSYRLRESRRARRLSIRVSPHAGVEVVVPRGTPAWQAERLVHERREWIERAVARLQARGMTLWQQPPGLPRRIDFTATGLSWPVRWYETRPGQERVRLAGPERASQVAIYSSHPEQLPVAATHRWLLSQGRRHLAPWLESVAADLELRYRRVRVGGQRTLWGSCSSRGTISLNYRLLFLPAHLCHYVMVHELCHLLHRDHSRRFWHRLEDLLPGAAKLDRELRNAGVRVPDWVEYLRSPLSG